LSGGNASASIIDFEGALNNERVRRGAGTDDEAAEKFWPRERGKEDRRRSDVKANGVNRRELERADRLRDELAHLLRREKIVARLRPPEAGKVDRQHLELLRQPAPDRGERKDALRPRTEEHNLLAAPPVRRVADPESVDGPPCDVERLHLLHDSAAHGTHPPVVMTDCLVNGLRDWYKSRSVIVSASN
jgi:hypothetical protein